MLRPLVVLLFLGLPVMLIAEMAGLLFTEDFSDQHLMDSSTTSANWSTEGKGVFLAWSDNLFPSGLDIGSEIHYTQSVALGDVNKDGYLDIVVGNQNESTILYLNNGDSGFYEGILVGSEKQRTFSVVLGDVNNDGYLDIVTGNYWQSNILYLNDGSGGFADSGELGITVGPNNRTISLALGDVNKDGYIDIVEGTNNYEPTFLFLNDGNGGFVDENTEGISIGSEALETRSISLGDVNNDGYLDIVAADYGEESNTLYINDGTGSFSSSTTTGIIIGSEILTTHSIALGDVNNDGHLDILVGNNGQSNILYMNNGFGEFADASTAGIIIGSETLFTPSVSLGDVNNDGHLDILAGNWDLEDRMNTLYLNDGNGGFADGNTAGADIGSTVQRAYSIALGDVNNDGYLDLVAGNSNQKNTLYVNNGGLYLNSGQVQSKKVNTSEVLSEAVIEVEEVVNNGVTSIDYYLSNDGGMAWVLAYPNESTLFPASGSDLRWKAELRTLSTLVTPVLSEVRIRLPENEGFNHVPEVSIFIKQRGNEVTSVFEGSGAVHVEVLVSDVDLDDTHSVRWYVNGNELSEFENVFADNLPSSLLVPGEHVIKMVVEDSGSPSERVVEERTITVKKQGNNGIGFVSLEMFLLLLIIVALRSGYDKSLVQIRVQLARIYKRKI
jgi:hypothetical protein